MEFEKNTIPVISTTECQQNDITETFLNLSPEEAGREVISTVEENFKLLEHLGRKIEEACRSADKANENAALAADKKIGFFGGGKAEAIEALQNAVIASGQAGIALSESQTLLFKQQEILAECTKKLFALCCININCAEVAIGEISKCLNGARREKISDVARKELLKFVQQLKEQISIYGRFESFKSKTENKFSDYNSMIENIGCKQHKLEEMFCKTVEELRLEYSGQLNTVLDKVCNAAQDITW